MNDTPKVAIVCLSHHKGGMELDAFKHTKLFIKHNIDTLLICKKDTFLEEKAISGKIKAFPINFNRKFSLRLIIQLRKILIKENISTLIFFGASEMKSICISVLGLNCNIIVRHGTTKSSSKRDIFHRLIYSQVKYYVGISHHLCNNILDILPAKKSQVKTIYPSLDTRLISKEKAHSCNFLFVGRVEQGKGIFDAIEALIKSRIPNEKKNLTIAGEVNKETQDKIEKLNKNGEVNITLLGYTENIQKQYETHGILLFPSYGEGFGNVVLEAVSNGLSCVVYENTIFPEFKSMGLENFYIAENKSTNSLAKCIELAHEEFYPGAENLNRNIITSIFNEDECIRKWKEIIN